MKLLHKAGNVLRTARKHWRTPPDGRYMNYREVCSYSFGGIGVYAVMCVVGSMMLSTTNILIGNTIGIPPQTMYLLYILAILASIPLTAFRANLIDNSRSRQGKYRPFLMKMGIPAVILSVGFVWAPYSHMSMTGKCATVLFFNIGFQFFFNFYRDAYENLMYLLSPDSRERSDVTAFKSIVYSIAPTIINPLMPLLASAITNGDLNDIRLYRFAYPPIAIIGILLTMLVYVNTREKTVLARTHVAQIKLLDALREVARNKYVWVISLAGWLGFLEGAQSSVLYWLYQYQGSCSAGLYAVIIYIIGDAATWGMLASPFAIRRFGKRKVLITANLLNVVFISILFPFIQDIWIVMIFTYLNSLVGSFAVVLNPCIEADIRDYQHYVTGERIDGMFAVVTLMGSIIGIATQGVLPWLYTVGGITIEKAREVFENPEIIARLMPSGQTVGEIIAARAAASGIPVANALTAYDALYDPDVFLRLIHILLAASVGGALLNVIPYLFYDLTENKQRGIVQVLRLRAFFEDYDNGLISDKTLVETVDMVREAGEYAVMEKSKPRKDGIRAARSTGDRAAVKAARKAYKAEREKNNRIESSCFLLAELHKFDGGALDRRIEESESLCGAGLESLRVYSPSALTFARSLPKSSGVERSERREAIRRAHQLKTSAKTIRKHFSGSIAEFDTGVYKDLYDREDGYEEGLIRLYKALSRARKGHDSAGKKQILRDIDELRGRKKALGCEIKRVSDQNAMYNRAVRPYVEARRLLLQYRSYRDYPQVEALYAAAKARLSDVGAEAPDVPGTAEVP